MPGLLGTEELVRWTREMDLTFNQNIIIFPPWIFKVSRSMALEIKMGSKEF